MDKSYFINSVLADMILRSTAYRTTRQHRAHLELDEESNGTGSAPMMDHVVLLTFTTKNNTRNVTCGTVLMRTAKSQICEKWVEIPRKNAYQPLANPTLARLATIDWIGSDSTAPIDGDALLQPQGSSTTPPTLQLYLSERGQNEVHGRLYIQTQYCSCSPHLNLTVD